MHSVNIDNDKKVYTTNYGNFKGVDLSTDAFLVDRARSPWAPNLISDTGGMPEKRMGWRTLVKVDSPINGIFMAVIGETQHILVHGGTKLYELNTSVNTVTELIAEVNNARSTSVFMGGKLYVFTGAEFLAYDGNTVSAVVGKIPEIIIGRSPTAGGGTALEAINLIQPKWCEGFLGMANVTEYQLSYGDLDAALVTAQKLGSDGTWTDLVENINFTVNRTTGKVTFSAAPGVSPVTGQDNVKITASKVREGYADKVNKATVAAIYSDNTIFAAGAEKGIDYRCDFSDPTFWPDTGYDYIGSNETEIMGYLPIGKYLAIIKEDNEQDSTVFLRPTATVDDETVFVRVPSVTGIGAVSKGAMGTLRGEPLFLSRQGVFAITSNIVTTEKMVQNR